MIIKQWITKLSDAGEVFTGGLISLFFKVSGIIIGYLFFIIISRWYGSSVLGIFSVCATILMMAGITGRWGIDTLIIKYLSEDNSLKNNQQLRFDYFKGLRLVIFFSLSSALIILLFNQPLAKLFFKNPFENNLIILTALAVLPASVMGYTAESFRGLKRVIPYSLFQNSSIYLIILLILWIFRLNNNYDNYVVHALFYSVLILSIGAFILFMICLPEKDSQMTLVKRKTSEILKISTPMMLGNSLYLIMNWTDILMIGAILSKSEVGIYNSAVKTAALGSVALAAMNTIAAPAFAEYFKRSDFAGLKKITRQTAFYSILLSLPVFLVIFIFPRFLLSFFGQDFIQAVPALIILAAGQLFNTFAGPTMYLLNMTGYEKAGRNILLIGSIFNILLNLLLIPVWGISGAAIATASSTFLWNLLAVIFIKKHFGFFTFPLSFRFK